MNVEKTKKDNLQILIHQVSPKTYKKVVDYAKKQKRSIGKTAEIMLEYYIEQNKL